MVSFVNRFTIKNTMLPLCSDFRNNDYDTFPLTNIFVLKIAENNRKQNTPKPSPYMILRLYFFLDRYRRKKAAPIGTAFQLGASDGT